MLVFGVAACGRIGFDPVAGDDTNVSGPFSVLRLDRVTPGEPLIDFPVPVLLDDQRARRDLMASDASDLRFYDASGNVLPHEIEQIGAPNGLPLVAWVRIPSIPGTSTTVEARYGGTPGPAATQPVWSGDFVGVWHFATPGTALDSANARDAIAVGTTGAPGLLGSARQLDDARTEYLKVADTSTITLSEFTVSGWIRMTTPPIGSNYYALLAREVGNTSDNDIYLGVQGPQPVALVTCQTASGEKDASGSPVSVGAWIHLAGTCTATQVSAFVDGARMNAPVDGPLISSTNRPIFFGADRGGGAMVGNPDGDYLGGLIDELRLQRIARTTAWLTYDAAAGRDQVITYGPVEFR